MPGYFFTSRRAPIVVVDGVTYDFTAEVSFPTDATCQDPADPSTGCVIRTADFDVYYPTGAGHSLTEDTGDAFASTYQTSLHSWVTQKVRVLLRVTPWSGQGSFPVSLKCTVDGVETVVTGVVDDHQFLIDYPV